MSISLQDKDIKTRGYVLRRTNYGEADRILNLIAPLGKISVIAKGVRKEKSKLAGGIEIFTLSEFTIHNGRGELGILTSAKMVKHHLNIIKDYGRIEVASMIMKKINRYAESSDSSEYFMVLEQCLMEIDDGCDLGLVEAWFNMNLRRVIGEEINLYRDVDGHRLRADVKYYWDAGEGAFTINDNGEFGSDEIKMLRLMVTSKLRLVRRVKVDDMTMRKVIDFARKVSGA